MQFSITWSLQMRQHHAFSFLTQPCLARQHPKHMQHSHLLFSLAIGMHWSSLDVDYTDTQRDHYLLACSLSLCSVPQNKTANYFLSSLSSHLRLEESRWSSLPGGRKQTESANTVAVPSKSVGKLVVV